MPRKDIYKDGVKTQFSSTNQPANSGRRPSVFAKYIRENRVSLDDIRALFSSMLTYDADEIKAILKDKIERPPVGIILLLKAISADMNKGEIKNYEILMNRVFGKPTQPVDFDPSKLSLTILTPEERKKRIEEILKKSESKPRKTGRK